MDPVSQRMLDVFAVLRTDDHGMVEKIDLDIQVPPTFPAQYYDALVRSAELCKVKKTLENPPKFEVKTVVTEAA